MAEKKRKKSTETNRLLGLYSNANIVNPSIQANDDAQEIVNSNGNVNNIASTLRANQGQPFSRLNNTDGQRVASMDNSDIRGGTITSNKYPGGSLDGEGETNKLTSSPDIRQENDIPTLVPRNNNATRVTPMYGGINSIPAIKDLLAVDEIAVAPHYADVITRAVGKAPGVDPTFTPGSPEAKLAAAMANTNPAPRSMWKRLGATLLRGASQINQNDTPETMLGKIIGNVVPGLIPSVDSKEQYKQNVAKAQREYGIETTLQKNQQARIKGEQDIAETAQKLKTQETDRVTKEQTTRILNQSRLDNVTRQRAENIMEGLSKLPENDPQRDALAKLLADPPYGIPVGRNYGLLSTEQKQEAQAAKDNKPLSESDLKRRAEATVKASYNPEEKARASTDARRDSIAQQVRDNEFKGKVTEANRAEYNRRVKEEYERVLQSNKAYSNAEYDKLLKAEMDRLRGSNASPAATSPRRNKGGKVQPSTNARSTDFRGVTIKLPGAKR